MKEITMKVNEKDYCGVDASIETSLFEYGMIWAEGIEGHEKDYHFIYAVSGDESGYNLFDWADIAIDTIPEKEWDWANFEDVSKFVGLSKNEFLKQPIPVIVNDMMLYYGYENIFGGSYNPFKVELI